MKNWRNGWDDISPPLEHKDPRPRFTKLRIGDLAIVIVPGPFIGLLPPEVSVKQVEIG